MYYKILITKKAYNHLRSLEDGVDINGIVCARSNSTPLFRHISEKVNPFVVATDAILAKSDCEKMNYLALLLNGEYVKMTFSSNHLVGLIKKTSKKKVGRQAPRKFGKGLIRL